MSSITTHVLDMATGQPAADIPVTLEFNDGVSKSWIEVGRAKTDFDGRVLRDLLARETLEAGTYCLRFDTTAASAFFPEVSIQFRVADTLRDYHVALLLGPYGYVTYRGS